MIPTKFLQYSPYFWNLLAIEQKSYPRLLQRNDHLTKGNQFEWDNMVLCELKLKNLEEDLKQQARNYLTTIHCAHLNSFNAESILTRLTGYKFDNLTSGHQISRATSAVEVALLRERKKARMKHYDYDLNRHIALHQAKKSLMKLRLAREAK